MTTRVNLAQAVRTRPLRGHLLVDRWHQRQELVAHARRFRGRHHAAAIAVVVLLAVFAFRLFPGQEVTVLSNGQAFRVSAIFDARQEALGAARITLQPGDRLIVADADHHASIAVQRARPVTVTVDGESLAFGTTAATAGGALAEAGVVLRPGDVVLMDGVPASERAPLAGVRYASGLPPASVPSATRPVALSVLRARPYTVYIDTARVDVSSAATTVEGLVADLGMTVREGDLVTPPLGTPLAAGMTVTLAKARTVNVSLNGKETSLYTQAETVGEVLELLGVNPGEGDILSPSRETTVFNGMNLVVGTTEVLLETVTEQVPAPTVFEEDPALPRGEVRIVNGAPGERVSTFSVTYRNGQETSRSFLSATLTTAPVPSRHITGTRAASATKPTVNLPGFTGTYREKVTVWATWYNASHGAWGRDDPNYGRTATGVTVDHGICAVDPSFIPLGTRFVVPGYGMCIAADTGGGIKGSKIDLGFPEDAGSNPWHTGYVDIYILD